MKAIKLDKPWTYLTPMVTIDFPAGEHRVKEDIYRKAASNGAIQEKSDGDRIAKAGSTGAADQPEG